MRAVEPPKCHTCSLVVIDTCGSRANDEIHIIGPGPSSYWPRMPRIRPWSYIVQQTYPGTPGVLLGFSYSERQHASIHASALSWSVCLPWLSLALPGCLALPALVFPPILPVLPARSPGPATPCRARCPGCVGLSGLQLPIGKLCRQVGVRMGCHSSWLSIALHSSARPARPHGRRTTGELGRVAFPPGRARRGRGEHGEKTRRWFGDLRTNELEATARWMSVRPKHPLTVC